jgi:hypothetical protein
LTSIHPFVGITIRACQHHCLGFGSVLATLTFSFGTLTGAVFLSTLADIFSYKNNPVF